MRLWGRVGARYLSRYGCRHRGSIIEGGRQQPTHTHGHGHARFRVDTEFRGDLNRNNSCCAIQPIAIAKDDDGRRKGRWKRRLIDITTLRLQSFFVIAAIWYQYLSIHRQRASFVDFKSQNCDYSCFASGISRRGLVHAPGGALGHKKADR
jgi:hypothetical protein